MPHILAVETSCDETAAAIVEDGRRVLSSTVASQVDLHAQFGGVFPEVASRQHIRAIYPIVDTAFQQAGLGLKDIDAIAVTRGPGLPGSLVVGLNMAKGLALASGLPLVGVNHLEGHIYSSWCHWPPVQAGSIETLEPAPQFPLVVLIVSGGHTELVLMRDHLRYERLGATLDDAAGEAFDKVARLIGLNYPGGPAVQKASEGGNPQAFAFPRAWLEDASDVARQGRWNFSFSGLKTAVLREVRRMQEAAGSADASLPVADLAASFQAAVVDVLVGKTLKAAEAFKAAEILVAGGVSANRVLRNTFLERSPIPVHIPPLALCTDNAAMVAAAGCFRFLYKPPTSLNIGMDVLPNWPLTDLESAT